ncbi:MAG: HD domain-containing protein [Candidatus Eremiobacteraeota bacterium]|nr:HD domain-containing protein [Candidatus Eremiobacteraeota bacterium]
MIQSQPKLSDFGGMVRLHHERFDGAGYPDGMDRARIPIGVRIVSVADSFNAMIGRRPYRTPFSPAHAAAELQRHAGTQFDPEVVRALIDVIAA